MSHRHTTTAAALSSTTTATTKTTTHKFIHPIDQSPNEPSIINHSHSHQQSPYLIMPATPTSPTSHSHATSTASSSSSSSSSPLLSGTSGNLQQQLAQQQQNQQQQHRKNERYLSTMTQRVQQMIQASKSKIRLNVGGFTFVCSVDTLTREPNTFFALMFNGHFLLGPDADGEYFIDRDGDLFYLILRHLRGYHIFECIAQLEEMDRNRLATEAEFYGIESMLKYFRRRPTAMQIRFLATLAPTATNDDDGSQEKGDNSPLLHTTNATTGGTTANVTTTTTTTSNNAVNATAATTNNANGSGGDNDDGEEEDGALILSEAINNDGTHAIAIDEETKCIYVSDSTNHRIAMFDSKGSLKQLIGDMRGSLDGEFNHPSGIALNSQGHLIVCDTDNSRVQIFDSQLNHIRTVGSRGGRAGRFLTPTSVAVDANDVIYVTDSGNHRIQIFSPEGSLQRVIGSGYERQGFRGGGSEDGELNTPSGIAVSSQNGQIYVLETCNNRIQVFSEEGKFLFKFGLGGTGETCLNNPSSIVLTDQGHLVVCDSGNHRLQIFDSNDGSFLNTVTSSNIPRPRMIAYGDNTLFVSDAKHSNIYQFELDA